MSRPPDYTSLSRKPGNSKTIRSIGLLLDPTGDTNNMTIDELLEQTVVDSYDVANIFKLPHDLVLAEVKERRENPALERAVYQGRRAEYKDCWFIRPNGKCLRYVEMNRIGLTWLVLRWQIPEVAEYARAIGRVAKRSRILQ